MVICCVPLCKSRQGKTPAVSFHKFPVSKVRDKWIKAISRKGPNNEFWFPKDRSKDKLKENDTKALFLSEQLSCLDTKHHKWSEDTIRQAVL
ncbi:hypothetical protein HPB49_012756 [Dermacentor silvarum]|uniref:Uncharacterized protein n=1 Tax=Dermacentor silvarum TaxID=543639 RepID=A0ACB8CRP0_DERSI|nr:hypothetical protein HPB49_012756 [Dermacentor silvarum]